jgi:hypothetical protein
MMMGGSIRTSATLEPYTLLSYQQWALLTMLAAVVATARTQEGTSTS